MHRAQDEGFLDESRSRDGEHPREISWANVVTETEVRVKATEPIHRAAQILPSLWNGPTEGRRVGKEPLVLARARES